VIDTKREDQLITSSKMENHIYILAFFCFLASSHASGSARSSTIGVPYTDTPEYSASVRFESLMSSHLAIIRTESNYASMLAAVDRAVPTDMNEASAQMLRATPSALTTQTWFTAMPSDVQTWYWNQFSTEQSIWSQWSVEDPDSFPTMSDAAVTGSAKTGSATAGSAKPSLDTTGSVKAGAGASSNGVTSTSSSAVPTQTGVQATNGAATNATKKSEGYDRQGNGRCAQVVAISIGLVFAAVAFLL